MGLWEVLSLHQVTLGSSKNGAPEASWPPALSQRQLRLGGRGWRQASRYTVAPAGAAKGPREQFHPARAGREAAQKLERLRLKQAPQQWQWGGGLGTPGANREPSLDRPPQNNASAV